MSLTKSVQVNTLYTRSINLERDGEYAHVAYPYVPTSRAVHTLARMAEAMHSGIAPRAWALVGPYGSGKSAFGLFVAQLLSASGEVASRHAHEVLRSADPSLSKTIDARLKGTTGYLTILVSGAPEPFAKRLLHSLAISATEYWRKRKGRAPSVVGQLRLSAASHEAPSVSELLDLLRRLQQAVAKAGGAGLLVVIDELGKFLEFEARHRRGGDTFLLQVLAEQACAADPAPMHLMVLMHQGFEFYAKGFGGQLRDEWRKVQGRFESVPFVETTEQALRIVRQVISLRLSDSQRRRVAQEVMGSVALLDEIGALPAGLDAKSAADTFTDCFPLHPVSLLVLPALCQRIAQSERTLFGYLGSGEPFGFIERLATRNFEPKSPLPWIKPHEIYEYFVQTQPGLMTDSATHRRWAEVSTAVERLGDAPAEEVALLKTIGLLNIIGTQGGLKASPALLSVILGATSERALKQLLGALQSKSLVTYRRYGGEYRVWQGSDFDIDAAVQLERDQLASLSTDDLINQRRPLEPTVARRHSIETGTLRYFNGRFCGAPTAGDLNAETPTLLYCLAESDEQVERIRLVLGSAKNAKVVAAILPEGDGIRDALLTTMALERVAISRGELANDPVAKREFEDRLALSREIEDDVISSIVEQPEKAEWFWAGEPINIVAKRDVQEALSEALDSIYCASPVLRNELINRDKPSSTAVAARNKLLSAMFEHPDQADLAIDKFPAEKAMYRALLRATGLHACRDGRWGFGPPAAKVVGETRIRPTWAAIAEFLRTAEASSRALSDLLVKLSAEPYGIKQGVLPVLVGAMCLAYRDEIFLFEEGRFVPFVGVEVIERAMKNPQAFGVQKFALGTSAQELLRRYAEAISGETEGPVNVVSVVKPLARLMATLPDYTKRTRSSVSNDAVTVRELFFSAKSPADLLLRAIPEALGFKPLAEGHGDSEMLDAFERKFQAAVVDLRVAYHGLLHELEGMLRRAFAIEGGIDLFELRTRLRGRTAGLDQYTIDVQGLRAFIGRLTDPFGDEKQWLISLGSFLGRKPPEKWSDDDRLAVQHRLADYAARLRELERLRIAFEEKALPDSDELDVLLVRTVVRSEGEREALVTLDAKKRASIQTYRRETLLLLEGLDPELRLVLLATLLREEVGDSAPNCQEGPLTSGRKVAVGSEGNK